MEDKSLQSTSPLGAAEYFETLTVIHLALIALGAVAAVLIIWWGTKLWRRRRKAMHQLEEAGRIERIGETAKAGAPEPAPIAPPVAPLSEPIPQPIPVAPSPPPIIEPEPATMAPASVPAGEAGDLTRLKGLGPKVAARLNALGFNSIADLAALDEAGAATLDAQLGNFRGRMARDRWIEQARLLEAGDVAGYEAQFGKLG